MPFEVLQRRALERIATDIRAILEAVPPDPPPPPKKPRAPFAPRILELAMAGLDDAAIAAAVGASQNTVRATISYARLHKGLDVPKRRRAGEGLLLHLDAATRGALAAAAKSRGLRVHELAAKFIIAGLTAPVRRVMAAGCMG